MVLMSTRLGSTLDAMAATSDGAPDPVLPELGCGVTGVDPPFGTALGTTLDAGLWFHRPWPTPTPAPIKKTAPSARAAALRPDLRPRGLAGWAGAQPGFGWAQAHWEGPGPPAPGPPAPGGGGDAVNGPG